MTTTQTQDEAIERLRSAVADFNELAPDAVDERAAALQEVHRLRTAAGIQVPAPPYRPVYSDYVPALRPAPQPFAI